MTTFSAYLAGHGSEIRTEPYVRRVEELVFAYLKSIGQPSASVGYWTPSRLIGFARYLASTHSHKLSTVERIFGVMSAVFNDAVEVRDRAAPLGGIIEGALMSHAPKIRMKRSKLAAELRTPDQKPDTFVPTLEEMARFIDALHYRHLRRWALMALATWARPEAITDLNPARQWDRRTNALNLNVEGRPETNKRRPIILACEALQSAFKTWQAEDDAQRRENGFAPDPDWMPLTRGNGPVASVKRGVKLTATGVELPGLTQKTPRTFMATQVHRLCPNLPRELRSRWMGHSVETGSRTTDHYEKIGSADLADVALATDYILQRLRRLCRTDFAIELRLNARELRRLGVKEML